MGSVEPPFLPQIHPESPGNGVSDILDFKPPSMSHLQHSHIRTPFTKSWIGPSNSHQFLLPIVHLHIRNFTQDTTTETNTVEPLLSMFFGTTKVLVM